MAEYVILPLPPGGGDGVGAAVDVSRFGSITSIIISEDFVADIFIEVSEFDPAPPALPPDDSFAPIAKFNRPNSLQTKTQVQSFMRTRVVNFRSGSPVVRVGLDFAPGPPGPPGAGAVLVWGNDTIGAAADTRFMTPGRNAAASLAEDFTYLVPRAGTLRNLGARHNSAGGNGNPIEYELVVNGVGTGITVSLATNAIGNAVNIIDTFAVLAGDRLALTATKAANIGGGAIDIQVSAELA